MSELNGSPEQYEHYEDYEICQPEDCGGLSVRKRF